MEIGRKVVIVDGARTPFVKAGTVFKDLMAYQLGATAIRGLLSKTNILPEQVDSVILGTVIHNIVTSNVAREAALTAGIPVSAPANTVTQACISANAAICQGIDMIRLGRADVIIAGGTDSVSDIPIGFHKKMRQKLFAARSLRSKTDMMRFLLSMRPKDFKPEIPDIAEFTTGVVMGMDCDIAAARYHIARQDQDAFAARSHQLAAAAQEKGYLAEEITPVDQPPKFNAISEDNGIRGNSTAEQLAKLKPAFDRKYGTLTAGNSSFLTDGAAVVLLMSEDKAKELGITPKATVRSYVFTGRDPADELLLGPAYATPKVLAQAGLELKDMDVIEFHEAFAAQVLYNIKLLNDAEFASKMGFSKPVGAVQMDKLNCWGGSLALGHPFGATGARLVATAAHRLHVENKRYALLAACAAGGHGHAMILERN